MTGLVTGLVVQRHSLVVGVELLVDHLLGWVLAGVLPPAGARTALAVNGSEMSVVASSGVYRRAGEVLQHGRTCKPEWHYMLPPEPRLPDARRLIAKNQYFVVHAPR